MSSSESFLEIDGSLGEGGGQILRTSLALSLITQTPFRIFNIRARRTKPGLRRQHLTAVRAAAAVGNAHVQGDTVGSAELIFRPGPVKGGEYEFDIGTAGSTTLVFQTVLPALLGCSQPSRLTLRGGTHNPGGPPWHFLQSVFLPVLERMGARITIQLQRYGFAPAGGGRWTAEILPSQIGTLALSARGELRDLNALALVAHLPLSIAHRELAVLRGAAWEKPPAFKAETVDADGPGNIVMMSGNFANVSELTTGFGQRGVPAENVAAAALEDWLRYEDSGAR